VLGDLAGGVLTGNATGVSACGLSELGGTPFDRLPLGAHRQGGHPSSLQGQYPPVADHLPCDGEGVVGRQLARGMLQHDRAQIAPIEHGVVFGELRLDAILDRASGCRALGCADQPYGLVWAEPVLAAGLCPHSLQVRACGQLLGAAVLEREVAQLAAFGCAAVAGMETLGRPCDLSGAPGEHLAQLAGNFLDLEVSAVLAGALLDRVPLVDQLVGERGAIERPQLPCTAEDWP
jgi:hypothetical protein